ncbi:MAG TPA: recombinase family protein [Anaerolineales bacterium]|nr:recombinase family protein [Anaerolineales bacterium]
MQEEKKRPIYEWSGTTIAHYLDRKVYKGVRVYGRKSEEPIEVEVPAIVPVELWEKACKIRKLKYVENIKNRKHSYLFARRIRCGLCSSVVLETTIDSLGQERSKPIEAIEEHTVSPSQIEIIHESDHTLLHAKMKQGKINAI